MDDRGGGGLPRAGRRAKALESGRMAAEEGSGATGNSATLGLGLRHVTKFRIRGIFYRILLNFVKLWSKFKILDLANLPVFAKFFNHGSSQIQL
jgi:hypothetical protein